MRRWAQTQWCGDAGGGLGASSGGVIRGWTRAGWRGDAGDALGGRGGVVMRGVGSGAAARWHRCTGAKLRFGHGLAVRFLLCQEPGSRRGGNVSFQPAVLWKEEQSQTQQSPAGGARGK